MAIYTGDEDNVSKTIESATANIPSVVFLGAALVAMGVSAAIKLSKKDDKNALFVGQWAAPFLLLGIYNKIVTTNGHD